MRKIISLSNLSLGTIEHFLYLIKHWFFCINMVSLKLYLLNLMRVKLFLLNLIILMRLKIFLLNLMKLKPFLLNLWGFIFPLNLMKPKLFTFYCCFRTKGQHFFLSIWTNREKHTGYSMLLNVLALTHTHVLTPSLRLELKKLGKAFELCPDTESSALKASGRFLRSLCC